MKKDPRTKANEAIAKAQSLLREACELIASESAYYDASDPQHAQTVAKYNAIVTACEVVGESLTA